MATRKSNKKEKGFYRRLNKCLTLFRRNRENDVYEVERLRVIRVMSSSVQSACLPLTIYDILGRY